MIFFDVRSGIVIQVSNEPYYIMNLDNYTWHHITFVINNNLREEMLLHSTLTLTFQCYCTFVKHLQSKMR